MNKEIKILHQIVIAQKDNTNKEVIVTTVLSDVTNVPIALTIVMMENVHIQPDQHHQIVCVMMDGMKLLTKLNAYNVNPNVKLAQYLLITVMNVETTGKIMHHYVHVFTDNMKIPMPIKLVETVTTHAIHAQEVPIIVMFVMKTESQNQTAYAQIITLIME